MCACRGTLAMVCMWRSEDNNVESVLSFYLHVVFVRIKLSPLGFRVSALPPKRLAAPLHIFNALGFLKQCCVVIYFDPIRCDIVGANGSGLGGAFVSLEMDRWRQCSTLSLSRCVHSCVCCSQPCAAQQAHGPVRCVLRVSLFSSFGNFHSITGFP